ncbi:MAG TPA: ribosome biogenesis GTPase Der [Acidiferrobacteraceae bacterium]|nr:ribosome biogenesis GTPase Der [Acidiferrobacteraceae bacterium]
MKPVVVLVGRPNVGKSTLFNALTRSRDAIVADLPGLTRDRQYGDGRIGDRPYLIVDTGGLAPDADTLGALAMRQTRQAIAEADALLFVVDGRAGPTGADREIAAELRRSGLPVTLAVNKAEGADPDLIVAEFHSLGLGAPVAVSAAHQRGIERLMDVVLAPLPIVVTEEPDLARPRIAIAGRPNVGKSTLANALLGEDRLLVSEIAGTTRDSVEIEIEARGQKYLFVDTAGLRRRARVDEPVEQFSALKTLQAIERANVVLLVLDAQVSLGEQDATIAGQILEQGRALVLVINKWDGVTESDKLAFRRELDRRFPFLDFAKPLFVSARERMRTELIFPAIDRAFASARMQLASPKLNRVLQKAVQALPPPIAQGRRIRLKYAHQGGRNPPLIVIHGAQTDALPESYRRYLARTFQKAFQLEGTPVRIELRSGANPYDPDR